MSNDPQTQVVEAERVLAQEPANAVAMLQLADGLMDLNDCDRALTTYRRALTLRTPFPEAHHNLAVALLHLGNFEDAIQECRLAIAERPGYGLAWNTLGAALGKVGRIDDAIAAFQQALHHQPNYAKAYHNLGNVLDQVGRFDDAKQAYRSALAINPILEEAQYDLAALGDGPQPPATPGSYLVRLFDTYARSFEQHLVEKLDYQVPEILCRAVMATGPDSGLEVIDLGSGTGLVGKCFRGLAAHLTGIDISPGMIRKAERLQVYDRLVLGDVQVYLAARQEPCDLILAADVFIYIGDLAAVFQNVARLLRPGGLFAFSLETTSQGDFCLRRNRRYAQSLAYIERLAGQNRLATVTSEPVQLRQGPSTEGRIILLRSLRQ